MAPGAEMSCDPFAQIERWARQSLEMSRRLSLEKSALKVENAAFASNSNQTSIIQRWPPIALGFLSHGKSEETRTNDVLWGLEWRFFNPKWDWVNRPEIYRTKNRRQWGTCRAASSEKAVLRFNATQSFSTSFPSRTAAFRFAAVVHTKDHRLSFFRRK